MRPARPLLLAATALATAALTAPTAFAQNLEVLGEEPIGGQEEAHHCPAIELNEHTVTGGCTIHFNTESDWVLRLHQPDLTELTIETCDMEFGARVDENGLGYIIDQIISSCPLAPCDEAAPSHATIPWPAGLFEVGAEPHSEEEVLVFTFCIRPASASEGAQGSPCTLLIDANPQPNHALELRANDAPCLEGTGIEFDGHWVSEGEGIETIHQDDIE